jgi:hypothetical protein
MTVINKSVILSYNIFWKTSTTFNFSVKMKKLWKKQSNYWLTVKLALQPTANGLAQHKIP